MNKILISLLVFLVIAVVLYFTGQKSVHHEISIKSSKEKVWKVLTSTDDYPEWNPTMKVLDGALVEGAEVNYQFTQDENNMSEIKATVVEIIPNQLLNQKGGIPFILTFNHKYMLESNGNETKVTIHEDYRGIMVNFWNPEPVEKAYQRLNNALQNRAENN